MLSQQKAIKLYHGSYCNVQQPDLSKCSKYKDFGQGFYLTTSREQAVSFARLTTYRAKHNGIISEDSSYGIVSTYRWTRHLNLDILEFPTADVDWLHCIVGHRKRGSFPEVVENLRKFDIITGKIANDDTNATIIAYMTGLFGQLGTVTADHRCIELLNPERLVDQLCFRSQKAISTLTYEGCERIWI